MENGSVIKWKKPESKSVGLFTDLTLFIDALKLCKGLGVMNLKVLRSEISERLVGLRYIEQLKRRAFTDLIRELSQFGWIVPKGGKKGDETFYEITSRGLEILNLYETDKKSYLRELCSRMQAVYTVPGWFVSRLWRINPEGQGQVVIPTPLKSWSPGTYDVVNYQWNSELEEQLIASYEKINFLIPGSLPLEIKLLISTVKKEYERLGEVRPRGTNNLNPKIKRDKFSPRGRLSIAMRSATVSLLFGNSYGTVHDFTFKTPLIKERTFMAWCPRLESLELIFYSDYFRDLPGRLIFPISNFKSSASYMSFELVEKIKSPDGSGLYFHQPTWENFKSKFLTALFNVYQNLHNKERILYVPLQDVRDEVCRVLRISSLTFENMLEQGFRSALMSNTNFSIALETDVRKDQTSGSQILRKPVYVQGVPHSLIALKPN